MRGIERVKHPCPLLPFKRYPRLDWTELPLIPLSQEAEPALWPTGSLDCVNELVPYPRDWVCPCQFRHSV